MIKQETIMADFRRVLRLSGTLAGLAILSQVAVILALRVRWPVAESEIAEVVIGLLATLATLATLACGFICVILFFASLLTFRLRGLWFGIPAIAAWALPFSVAFTPSFAS